MDVRRDKKINSDSCEIILQPSQNSLSLKPDRESDHVAIVEATIKNAVTSQHGGHFRKRPRSPPPSKK